MGKSPFHIQVHAERVWLVWTFRGSPVGSAGRGKGARGTQDGGDKSDLILKMICC
jgi:hypothetical protein